MYARRGRGVPQACAIEVKRESPVAGRNGHVVNGLKRPDPAAADVVGGLDADQFHGRHEGLRRVWIGLRYGGGNIFGGEDTARSGEKARIQTRDRKRRAVLVDVDVRVVIHQNDIAGLGVRPQSQLIRHRP